jgi:hypothetical protein
MELYLGEVGKKEKRRRENVLTSRDFVMQPARLNGNPL